MKYVIDGTNVCWWGEECSIANILSLVIEILRNSDDFYCIFDASTPYKLKNKKEVILFNCLLKEYPDKFTMVTGATRADYPVLVYANTESLKIISNDRYRDYYQSFPWLEKSSDRRLIKANVLQGDLVSIEGMGNGFFKLSHDNETTYKKIKSLLDKKIKNKEVHPKKISEKITETKEEKGKTITHPKEEEKTHCETNLEGDTQYEESIEKGKPKEWTGEDYRKEKEARREREKERLKKLEALRRQDERRREQDKRRKREHDEYMRKQRNRRLYGADDEPPLATLLRFVAKKFMN